MHVRDGKPSCSAQHQDDGTKSTDFRREPLSMVVRSGTRKHRKWRFFRHAFRLRRRGHFGVLFRTRRAARSRYLTKRCCAEPTGSHFRNRPEPPQTPPENEPFWSDFALRNIPLRSISDEVARKKIALQRERQRNWVLRTARRQVPSKEEKHGLPTAALKAGV